MRGSLLPLRAPLVAVAAGLCCARLAACLSAPQGPERGAKASPQRREGTRQLPKAGRAHHLLARRGAGTGRKERAPGARHRGRKQPLTAKEQLEAKASFQRQQAVSKSVEVSNRLEPDVSREFENESPELAGGVWDFETEESFAAPVDPDPMIVPVGLVTSAVKPGQRWAQVLDSDGDGTVSPEDVQEADAERLSGVP